MKRALIKVICLSHFLLFLPDCRLPGRWPFGQAGRQGYCTLDKFVMTVVPGHPTSLRYVGQSAHLHAIEILHLDRFLAPKLFITRHFASAVNKITVP